MALQSTTALATITLQAAANQVTFSSIPNNYRDLILTVVGSNTSTNMGYGIQLNGDSTTSYSQIQMYATSTGFAGSSGAVNKIPLAYHVGAGAYSAVLQLLDYSSADRHKAAISRANDNTGTQLVIAYTGRWANTAPVVSLSIVPDSGTIAVGTVFALYGRIA